MISHPRHIYVVFSPILSLLEHIAGHRHKFLHAIVSIPCFLFSCEKGASNHYFRSWSENGFPHYPDESDCGSVHVQINCTELTDIEWWRKRKKKINLCSKSLQSTNRVSCNQVPLPSEGKEVINFWNSIKFFLLEMVLFCTKWRLFNNIQIA